MEGNLYKWTNYFLGWRERYFVLKGGVVYYYYKKGEKPRGRIHLGVCSINNAENHDLKFELDTGTNIIYIKSESLQLKEEWVRALKLAKIDLENKQRRQSNTNIMNVNNENNAQFFSNYNTNQIDIANNDFNTNRSVISEDKLLRKINNIYSGIEKLVKNNDKFEVITKTNADSELSKICSANKTSLNSVYNQVDDLKKSFIRFNRDFVKLSEYFLNRDGKEIVDENSSIINNDSLINDNNHIEKARSSNKKGQFMTFKPKDGLVAKNKESTEDLNTSKHVLHKDEDVFYGAEEHDDDNNEKEEDQRMNSENNEIEADEKEFISNEIQIETKVKESSSKITSLQKPKKKYYDPIYIEKRKELPIKKLNLNLNVWSILKDAIGRDLSKFCVPVYFNEPISMLQRLCENFQYAPLLSRAAKEANAFMRLCLISAFCVGGYSMNIHRTLKFFNPLLSETFEYIDNDLDFRYYGEQVSHHPPISACYAEGDGYSIYTNTNAESKLRISGNLEFHPIGRTHVHLEYFNEHISFTKPKAIVKNLIMGKMYLDAFGKVIVNNNTTGDVCELELFEKTGDVQGRIYGEAKDFDGNVKLIVEGNWLSHLDVVNPLTGDRETIWKMATIPGNEEERFFFTDFTVNLNNITDEMRERLPPSDTRFRPDQRFLELQDYEKASNEKHRLEEKQRATRRDREKTKFKYNPIYFEETYDDLTGELIYKYKGGYFEDRQNKNFSKFHDIY